MLELSDQLVQANSQLVVSALRAQTDAAAAKQSLEALARSSELDALTELPNRQSLLSRFKYAAAIARRSGTQLAFLFVDLNNFKQINDTLGHGVGDQVLRLVAKRLAIAVRESDTVSRHGGDEFLILLPDISHAADVMQIARQLIAALGRPTRVGKHSMKLTASIGVSLFPRDAGDIDTLIRHADAAMYRAKRGHGGVAFHNCESTENDNMHLPPPERSKEDTEYALPHQIEFLMYLDRKLRDPLMSMPQIHTLIERRVAHLSRLDTGSPDTLRGSTCRAEPAPRTSDLTDAVHAAVAACRPRMDERLQHLTVDIGAGVAGFFGESIHLIHIVSNLLDHASKYANDSGHVTLSVAQSDNSVEITVKDNGIGMSAEDLAAIVEREVGLTAVRDLAGAYGGTLTASSTGHGCGSTFVVVLPNLGRGQ
jgi:diguanylate cyclase (GGDEF)-like protein